MSWTFKVHVKFNNCEENRPVISGLDYEIRFKQINHEYIENDLHAAG